MNTISALISARTEHRAASEGYDHAAGKFRLTQEIMDRYRDSAKALAEAELVHKRDLARDAA
jgi:hypothetical protein